MTDPIPDLRRLLAEATPEPWVHESGGILSPGSTRRGDGKPKRCRSRDRPVVAIEPDGACGNEECCPQGYHLELSMPNAALIVAMRNHLLPLLDRVERAEKALARWVDHPSQNCGNPSCRIVAETRELLAGRAAAALGGE